MLNSIDKWHKTKLGLLVFALVELGIAYGFASLAIDRGNFWYYLLTLIFLVGFLQNSSKLIVKIVRKK
jgi:hypothetical protein